jgi:hypothetical protein
MMAEEDEDSPPQYQHQPPPPSTTTKMTRDDVIAILRAQPQISWPTVHRGGATTTSELPSKVPLGKDSHNLLFLGIFLKPMKTIKQESTKLCKNDKELARAIWSNMSSHRDCLAAVYNFHHGQQLLPLPLAYTTPLQPAKVWKDGKQIDGTQMRESPLDVMTRYFKSLPPVPEAAAIHFGLVEDYVTKWDELNAPDAATANKPPLDPQLSDNESSCVARLHEILSPDSSGVRIFTSVFSRSPAAKKVTSEFDALICDANYRVLAVIEMKRTFPYDDVAKKVDGIKDCVRRERGGESAFKSQHDNIEEYGLIHFDATAAIPLFYMAESGDVASATRTKLGVNCLNLFNKDAQVLLGACTLSDMKKHDKDRGVCPVLVLELSKCGESARNRIQNVDVAVEIDDEVEFCGVIKV